MKLTVKNFAKIKHAELEFDGITVIAGNNDTGKSTIGKILYVLFHTLHDMEHRVLDARILENVKIIEDSLMDSGIPRSLGFRMGLRRRIQRKLEELFAEDIDCTTDIGFDSLYEYLQHEYGSRITEGAAQTGELDIKLKAIQNIPYERIEKKIIDDAFQDTFLNQVNSLSDESATAEIILYVKNHNIDVSFNQHRCSSFRKEIDLFNQAVYIDNPFIMDYVRGRRIPIFFSSNASFSIDRDLLEFLNKEMESSPVASLLLEDKLLTITNIMNTVIPGTFINKSNGLFLRRANSLEEINVRNLSAGLKSFAIIKRLLENASLKEKDVLILDEPEIHLHPQWQLIYAELVVLLQKTFQLTVLLTTHSPFFLDAIEVFSAKHKISDCLHYYCSSLENRMVTFTDVTNHIDSIYKKMSAPIQDLENMRSKLRMEM